MYETIGYEERGDTATVTLVRPRINVAQLRELERVCDHLEDASPCTVAVFAGHSEGIDFADFDPKETLDIHGFAKWEKLVGRIERLGQATIASVDGDCLGGGFQLLLACDIRAAAPGVGFALPEVSMGFLPGMATWRLARYVGLGRAKRLVLTGARVATEEAVTLGLVDFVAPTHEARLAAARTALGPTHTVAITLARRLLTESFDASYEDALGHFLAAQHRAISQSAFLKTLERERSGR
jgi:enoyl-CoA hydratase/carnithine racemase